MTTRVDSATSATDPRRRSRIVLANVALLFMAVIWAVNFSIAKLALGEMPPMVFNALRFPLAAAALLFFLRLGGRIPLPERRDWRTLIGLGLLGNLLYQQFFIFGLNRTRAGTAALLIASSPLLTALLSAAVGHERVHWRTWLGLACTIIGIGVVVLYGGGSATGQGTSISGALLLIGASIAWACYTVGSRDLVQRYGAIPVTAWTLWIGATGVFLSGLPQLIGFPFARISALGWFGVVYAGVLSIGLAYVIWYNGVKVLGNTRTSTYSNLVPVITLLVAWLWLGDKPTAGQIAGAAIIIGGVTLAQLRIRNREAE